MLVNSLDNTHVEEVELEPLQILQISDLHFGTPFDPVVAESLVEATKNLRLDALVVSGDLTQRARREQFLAASDFLRRLPDVPRLVVPGNHDVPLYNIARRLMDPLRNYKDCINPDLNPILRLPKATLVGLDSTAPGQRLATGAFTLGNSTFVLEHLQTLLLT